MNVVITEEEAVSIKQPEPRRYTPRIPSNYWDHRIPVNYVKALKELIDNSLNNRFDYQKLNFVIQHFLDDGGNIHQIQFHDDGKGVNTADELELDGWIGIKFKKTANQLSTHGVGMKHALAAFDGTQGVNWVATNHSEAGYCSFDSIGQNMQLYDDDRFWSHRPSNIGQTGMSACVNHVKKSACKAPRQIGDATSVIGELGAIYKYYIQNNYLNIRMDWITSDGNVKTSHTVGVVTRPYINKGRAEPEVNAVPIVADDNSWEIKLTFGKNAKTRQELINIIGMDSEDVKHLIGSRTRHPYAATSEKTGMDIVEHNRVIELNAQHIISKYDEDTGERLSEDKMVRAENVGMGGQVELIRGFTTTETKEIFKDLAYRQMCNKVYEYLTGGGTNATKKNYFRDESKENAIKGNEWRDAVAATLTDSESVFGGKEAITEHPVSNYNLNTDIFIVEENLPIECKYCEVDFGHIAKFRSEMELHGVTSGWIVTSVGFSDDAKREIQRLKNNGITIEMKDWSSKASRVLQILDE